MATDPPVPPGTVHATCLLVGEAAILIRGESGAGKSTLALALLDRALQDGSHAALVGDDRIGLERHHGRIVARGHPALRGLIEIRGLGLVRASSWAEAGIVRLVVDLAASLPRLPDVAPGSVDLLGVSLPRLMLDRTICAGGLAPRLVLDGLYGGGSVASRTHLTAVSCDPAGGM